MTQTESAPTSSPSLLTGLEFVGHWIGETMAGSPAAGSPAAGSPAAGSPAADSPAHLWEIHRSNSTLIIKTRWEGEAVQGGYFSTAVPHETPSFEIKTNTHLFVATLVDPQHFIIRNWDTNDVRDDKGANYDVVFSRLGVAELQARAVWQRHKDALPKAKRIRKTTREQEAAQQWRGLQRVLNQATPKPGSAGSMAGQRARRSVKAK